MAVKAIVSVLIHLRNQMFIGMPHLGGCLSLPVLCVCSFANNVKFDPTIWCSSSVKSIFIKRPLPAKMMLSKALPLFCIPVAGQC